MTLTKRMLYLVAKKRYFEFLKHKEELWEKYYQHKTDRQAYIASCMCEDKGVELSQKYENVVGNY